MRRCGSEETLNSCKHTKEPAPNYWSAGYMQSYKSWKVLKIINHQFVSGQRWSQDASSCCDCNWESGLWNDGVSVKLPSTAPEGQQQAQASAQTGEEPLMSINLLFSSLSGPPHWFFHPQGCPSCGLVQTISIWPL